MRVERREGRKKKYGKGNEQGKECYGSGWGAMRGRGERSGGGSEWGGSGERKGSVM